MLGDGFFGFAGLTKDIFGALKGHGDRGEVVGTANLGEGLGAGDGIDYIVGAGGENGVDDIVGESANVFKIELEALAQELGDFRVEIEVLVEALLGFATRIFRPRVGKELVER